jgi:hypothetical protein
MAGINPMLDNGLGSPFNIHTSYTENDRPHKVGTRGRIGDRVYYWARNATTVALARNELIVAPAITTNHHDQTVTAAADFTAGSMDVVLTVGATAIALREYEEGFVFISDGTAEGFIYQIRRHAGNAGSLTSTAALYSPVVVTTAAASTMSLARNRYMNPVQSLTTQLCIPVGVANIGLPAATSAATNTAEAVGATYGWLQTWGLCPVLCDESVASIGDAITVGTGTAGAAEEDDTATTVSQEFIIGYNVTPFVDTEFQLVDLRIRA